MFKFRKKIKFLLPPLLVISLIFIFYQLRMFAQLTSSTRSKQQAKPIVFGIHEQRQSFYEPDEDNNFRCIHSMEVIDFSKINDDYCDCEDGTDEPGTNACPNGIFYCLTEENGHRKALPTHLINDGVCDCCDGSDEVQKRVLKFRLKDIVQEKLGKFMSPCKNRCKHIDVNNENV